MSKVKSSTLDKKVKFIQYDIPPMKAGEYKITVNQDVSESDKSYETSKIVAVAGERFTLDPSDFNSIFPQNHANGEFSGVLPLAVFNRRTLPWERTSVMSEQTAPWLAVLLFNADELPDQLKNTAESLVTNGQKITVWGSDKTGVGTLPDNYYSYPDFEKLDYGESPTDPCITIDIPKDTFNSVCPSAKDLPWLAHIRETETIDKENSKVLKEAKYSVISGNRIPQLNSTSYAFLVSLENMGDQLPAEDGGNNLPDGTTHVRLITYKAWSFSTNTLDEAFKELCENLNKTSNGEQELGTIQYPFSGTPPTTAEVQTALDEQASSTLTEANAKILGENALQMGYIPMNEQLRHGGNTVSWYRGPLSPYSISENVKVPVSGPDAANRYNPQTGLFDVSYGSAWQLGKLLALQNEAFSTALFVWKKTQTAQEIAAAEAEIIKDKLADIDAFSHVFQRKNAHLAASTDPPEVITTWLAKLTQLEGVPFNYLVPNEVMVPKESIRFFYFDLNWIDMLIDGAFSIGRSTSSEHKSDVKRYPKLRDLALNATKGLRKQKPELENYVNKSGEYTGFLLRSALVSGWPGLQANGYTDLEGNDEVPKLWFKRLSPQVMLCIFDDEVQMVALHEPPEALHGGVEGSGDSLTTTLRSINGNHPGEQIIGATAPIPVRTGNQTLNVDAAAAAILKVLNAPPLSEGVKESDFTSAQFGLEMVKGVVKVEYQNKTVS